jgi:AmpE protein
MSAALIAVVVSLLLGHLFPAGLAALRRYDWFIGWLHWLAKTSGTGEWPNRVGLLIAVGLPLLLVGAIQFGLDERWYSLPAFAFALVVLLYTWGPRDLNLDVEAVIEARDPDARRAAAAALFPEGGEPVVEGPTLVEAVFRCALWRWFGVLFWFLVAGAVGALGYRLIALCAQGEARRSLPEGQRGVARTALALLNWPVAQLMTFALALAADFDKVISAWRDWHAQGARLDSGFLGAAARASVASELAEEDAYAVDGPAQAPDLLELRDAMSLVWRILLLWLGVLALLVLAGWTT